MTTTARTLVARLRPLGIAVLAALTFAAVLPGARFVFDDHVLIEHNMDIFRNNIGVAAFTQDYYKTSQQPGNSGYYRPIAVLLNGIDAHVYHADNVGGYHATNLLLHAAATAALAPALMALGAPTAVAWIVALFFAVHPSHAESVAFISGRVDVLAALGIFVALALAASRRRFAALGFGAAALFAYLSKESALVLPGLVFLVWLAQWLALPEEERVQQSWATRWIVLGVASLVALVLRFAALGSFLPVAAHEPRAGNALLLPFQSLLFALASLYAPIQRLAMEPEPGGLQPVRLCAGLVVAGILWVAAWRADRSSRPFLQRCAWAGGLALVPVLNFLPQETPLSERFLYLASGFWLAPVGVLVHAGWKRRSALQPVIALVTALACIGLLGISAWRARAWCDDTVLWRIATQEEPRRATFWARYGLSLMERERLGPAREALGQAVQIAPHDFTVLHWMGMALHRSRRQEEALEFYERALKEQPRNVEAQLNTGLALSDLRRFQEAWPYLERAVQLAPNNVDVLQLAGRCALDAGRLTEARQLLERAAQIGPDHPELANMLKRLRDREAAAATLGDPAPTPR